VVVRSTKAEVPGVSVHKQEKAEDSFQMTDEKVFKFSYAAISASKTYAAVTEQEISQ
jgi:hypothetical protein